MCVCVCKDKSMSGATVHSTVTCCLFVYVKLRVCHSLSVVSYCALLSTYSHCVSVYVHAASLSLGFLTMPEQADASCTYCHCLCT